MKRYILALIITITCFPLLSKGQQQLIDSLRMESLKSDISPGKRVMILADLGMSLRYQDIVEAMRIGEEAIRQSHGIKDKQYASYAWACAYYTYRKADTTELVLTAVDSCKWYAEKSDNKLAKGNAFRIAGSHATYLNQEVKSVEYFLEALELLKGSEMIEEQASIYYQLSGKFATTMDLKNEEKYARLCLQLAKSTNNPNVDCLAGLCMSTFFNDRFPETRNQLDADSVIYFVKEAFDTFEQYRPIMKSQFAGETAAMNYAAFLWQYLPDTPKDTISDVLNKAITWAQYVNDQSIIAGAYALLSEYMVKQGDYEEAESILLSSLFTMQDQPSPNYYAVNNIVGALIRLSEKMGDKDRTIKYYKMYLDTYKKVYDMKQMSETKNLEATFNHHKKEQEINILQKQASFNKKINIFSIGMAVLCIVGLFLTFVSYHLKLKSANQQKELSEVKAKEAEMQRLLKEEEARRLELEQKLIAQEKEQLQKEVFAGAVQLKQKNELLKTVQDQVANTEPSRNIDRIIKENLKVDDSFNEYKSLIRKTHPHFFNSLQDRAKGKLTDLDLKYCTFIYMNIPLKQMAGMLHVEYSTIRMSKHRLKQKLNLAKEEDLDLFIRGIA